MKRVQMLILIAIATTAQASVALAADKASQEDVPDAPTSGLDLDLSQTLSAAEHATQAHQNERALTLLLPVFAAPNRFSLAQQKLLLPRSVLSLRRAAEGAVAQGNMQLALKGFDTAWQLDAKADRVYATALVAAAERERSEDPSAALWLVRRARIVDPSYEAASDRDRAWSHNQLAPYGYGLLIAGLASVVAGIACSWLSYSAENGPSTSTAYLPQPHARCRHCVSSLRPTERMSRSTEQFGNAFAHHGRPLEVESLSHRDSILILTPTAHHCAQTTSLDNERSSLVFLFHAFVSRAAAQRVRFQTFVSQRRTSSPSTSTVREASPDPATGASAVAMETARHSVFSADS
jgi:hypothetical protein